jgi:hypothetical protein
MAAAVPSPNAGQLRERSSPRRDLSGSVELGAAQVVDHATYYVVVLTAREVGCVREHLLAAVWIPPQISGPGATTIDTGGQRRLGLPLRHRLEVDPVLPVVAEVVDIVQRPADVDQNLVEPDWFSATRSSSPSSTSNGPRYRSVSGSQTDPPAAKRCRWLSLYPNAVWIT